MQMGMTPDDFWHGEPRLVESYRTAWKLRRQSAYLAEWRSGIYVAEAIATVMGQNHSYPKEPLFTTETEEEAAERRAREEMLAMKEAFLDTVARMKEEKCQRQSSTG